MDYPQKETGVAYGPFCVLSGSGLSAVRPGQAGRFTIVARDGSGNDLERGGDLFTAHVIGRGAVGVTIRDLLDGRYEGSFRLTVGGDYRLEVRLAGVRVGHEWVTIPAPSHVVNSPSHVHCHASVGRALHGMTLVVEGEGLKRAQVAEAAKFKVHAVAPESANRRSAAPHCRIEVRLYKPDMLLRPDGLVAEGRATKARSSGGIDDARETSTWECSYKARVAGQFLLMVTADGAPLRDSPYAVRVLPGRVDLTQCSLRACDPSGVVRAMQPARFELILRDRLGNGCDVAGTEAEVVAELREPRAREHAEAAAAAAAAALRGDDSVPEAPRRWPAAIVHMGGDRYELRVMPSFAGAHELRLRHARRDGGFAPTGRAALAESRTWTCDVQPCGRPHAFAMMSARRPPHFAVPAAPPRYPMAAW